MTPYKSNSALYLDYLATVRTREQIEADPRLCVFLNNPYIKDNMEIALLHNAAKTGDYVDKMAFVEYFMCNGPELDADTILHYRTKIALDPVCAEIAYSYYSDMDYVNELRESKYNKKSDNGIWDCFSKPCFYMGRFSSAAGKHAKWENVKSMWNCVAEAFSMSGEEKENQIKEAEQNANPATPLNATSYVGNMISNTISDASQTVQGAVDAATGTGATNPIRPSGDRNPQPSPIGVEKHLWGWIPTTIKEGIGALELAISGDFKEFCEKLQEVGRLDADQYGDPLAAPFAKRKELLVEANIKRSMGDCARVWDHARRIEIFNPAQNTNSPIPESQLPGDVNPNGTQNNGSSYTPMDAGLTPVPVVVPVPEVIPGK